MEFRNQLLPPSRFDVFLMIARRLQITGRVQGVGFRYAMQDEAARLGVNGWVRNRSDGSVEALLQGEADALEALTAWARRGPPGARVSAVQITGAEEDPHSAFELRPTL
jgi:acylphosphatase